MSNRANSSNTLGTTQTQAGNVTTNGTWITTYPRPNGAAITVTSLNGAMTAAGASVGDAVERGSDGGFWDTVANCNVPAHCVSQQPPNTMVSN